MVTHCWYILDFIILRVIGWKVTTLNAVLRYFSILLNWWEIKSNINGGNFEYCNKFGIQSTSEYHWTRATYSLTSGMNTLRDSNMILTRLHNIFACFIECTILTWCAAENFLRCCCCCCCSAWRGFYAAVCWADRKKNFRVCWATEHF